MVDGVSYARPARTHTQKPHSGCRRPARDATSGGTYLVYCRAGRRPATDTGSRDREKARALLERHPSYGRIGSAARQLLTLVVLAATYFFTYQFDSAAKSF